MSDAPTVPYESSEDARHLPAHLRRIASRDYVGVNEGFWILQDAAAEIERLREVNAALVEALAPFAEAAATLDVPEVDGHPFNDPDEVLWAGETGVLTVEDFRRAARAGKDAPPTANRLNEVLIELVDASYGLINQTGAIEVDREIWRAFVMLREKTDAARAALARAKGGGDE